MWEVAASDANGWSQRAQDGRLNGVIVLQHVRQKNGIGSLPSATPQAMQSAGIRKRADCRNQLSSRVDRSNGMADGVVTSVVVATGSF